MANPTTVARPSDREISITRRFEAPLARVYAAWSDPALFQKWWPPQSMGVPLFSCEMDVRTGGSYRIAFGTDAAQAMAFFGRYLEVVPEARIVWTNEESPDGAVTTVTFAAEGEATRVVFSERYPSQVARDAASDGMETGMQEQFAQLDALLAGG